MSMYESFAELYDAVMGDAPYQEWMELIESRFQLSDMDIADLGCGTGMLTVWLGERAQSCVGVDASEAMLAQAQARVSLSKTKVTWMAQDISVLRLPAKVDLALITCDVLNYITSPDALVATFSSILRNLKSGGWLAFDVIGPSRLSVLKHGYWHQIEDEIALLHETVVEDEWVTHEVVGFLEQANGLYRRIDEQHQQRYYERARLYDWLASCGYHHIEITGDFGRTSVEDADRLVCLAKKPD